MIPPPAPSLEGRGLFFYLWGTLSPKPLTRGLSDRPIDPFGCEGILTGADPELVIGEVPEGVICPFTKGGLLT